MNQPKYKYPLGELITWAEQCAKDYYVDGSSQLTDDEFDSLKITIANLCKNQHVDPCTVRILRGVGYVGDENKLKHPVRMFSLSNSYDTEQLAKWFTRIYSDLRKVFSDLEHLDEPLSYGIEYKIDGMSLDLAYRFGRLTSAITRGDGVRGENIISSIHHVDAIPKTLNYAGSPVKTPLLVIHGELYVTKSELKRFNGLSPWSDMRKPLKNERSAVLCVRNKDFGSMGMQLSFNPHEVASVSIDANDDQSDHVSTIPEDLYSASMYQRLEALKHFGFNRASPLSPPIQHSSIRDVILHIDRQITETERSRFEDTFDLPIDGLVISVDTLEYRLMIGHTARVPKWAMAYKFPALGQKTHVKHVNWQVTMDGNLIPVLSVEPVEIGGASVSKITLFNYAKFKAYDLHSHDSVTAVRCGDVVPMIAEVHADVRDSNAVPIKAPANCPSCGSKLSIVRLHLICSNSDLCLDQLVASLLRFVGTSGMNIRGFGEYGLRKLVELKRISTPVDLYKLDKSHSTSQTGLAWSKVLSSIERSKSQDFLQVLKALNVPKPRGGYGTIITQHRNLETWIDDTLAKSESGDDSPLTLWVRNKYPMLKELFHLGVGHVNYDHDGGA